MQPRHRHRLAASMFLLGLAAPLVLLSGSPATAVPPKTEAASGTATVGLSSDAWYSTTPACTASPTGCLPAGPPSTYPAKTLHVGVGAGQEESRTYLVLDLASLPVSTSLTGGSLRLPVSSGDGSRAPETASFMGCLVTEPFKDDVQGSSAVPPKVDCKKATAPAKFVAGAGDAPAAFTLDLSPFAAAWASGSANQGLALIPGGEISPTSVWHVAMSARDRKVEPAMHISATVSFTSSSAVTDDSFTSPPPEDQFVAPPPADAGFSSGGESFAAPPLASTFVPESPVAAVGPAIGGAGPAAAPVLAAPALVNTAFSPGGYAYPIVFLLPLLLALAGGLLARALTRDLTPPQ